MQIHTERLLLRPIQKQDASAVFGYRSDAPANQYQSWIPETVEDVVDFIQNRVCPISNQPGTWYQLAVVIKENEEIIGDIGIHFIDQDNHQAELGVTLDKKHQGNGYATEAMRTVINFLFTELYKHRIIASVDPRNEKSVNLLHRLGFRQEAHFRKSLLVNGQWTDDLIFARLQND